jgi:hypothetical protein
MLQVGVIHYPPFVTIPEDYTTNYLEEEANMNLIDGTELRLLLHLSGKFHFEAKVFLKKEGELWGMVYDNGSTDGVLGSIIDENLQLGIGGFNWDLRFSGIRKETI